MSASKSLTDVAVEPLPSPTNNEHEDSPDQRTVSTLDVLVQGVALFSDGYNVQIMGYMTTVMKKLYYCPRSNAKFGGFTESYHQIPEGLDFEHQNSTVQLNSHR